MSGSAYTQAREDWLKLGKGRPWRPVSHETAMLALGGIPPLSLRLGFICGEPAFHTHLGEPVHPCFRKFNGTWHMIYASPLEHVLERFPLLLISGPRAAA